MLYLTKPSDWNLPTTIYLGTIFRAIRVDLKQFERVYKAKDEAILGSMLWFLK
jgi:hypothetical protein